MRNRIVHTLAAAAALVAALTVASPAGAAGSYTDATGDGSGAPDITRVSLASDGTGQLVFTIAVDALPSAEDVQVLLFMNTDGNLDTGAAGTLGADYVLVNDRSNHTYGFARWNGSDWDWDTPYSTVRVSTGSNYVMFAVNRSELGNTSGLNFWVRTVTGDVSAKQYDDAPDQGSWNYSLGTAGPTILGLLVQGTPTLPKAGQLFTLAPAGLKLPPDGSAISLMPQPESYSCVATLAGKRLVGRGVGGCSWLLPKKTRGKTLHVVVTALYQGATTSVPFDFPVS
jgi:hypothetical protein